MQYEKKKEEEKKQAEELAQRHGKQEKIIEKAAFQGMKTREEMAAEYEQDVAAVGDEANDDDEVYVSMD